MGTLIAGVADLAAQYPGLATAIVFLAAIIEAVAVLGMIIPGTPILMAVAGAAAIAGLPMLPFLIVSILGAVIGDVVSFFLGCRYAGHLRRMWPFKQRPQLISVAEQFFGQYGAVAVAAARFVPVLRSTVPLVAGMAGMRRARFLVANILSALLWAPAHIYPAQLAGLSLDRIADGDWSLAMITVVVFAALGGCGFALQRWVRRGLRRDANAT
jgi:membrane protein DedA with SNARE-associated domain